MKFGEWEVFEIAVVDDKNVVTRFFKLVKVETDSFVEAATDAIAADGGFVDFFRNNYSEAGFAAVVVAEN